MSSLYNSHRFMGDTTALVGLLVLLGCCICLIRQNSKLLLYDGKNHNMDDNIYVGLVDGATTTTRIQKYAAVDAVGVLNVHLVPHTHDDVGWRKTVEQYFYGWNTSIDTRGFVKDILTSSMESLLLHEYRTFHYVESKFLSLWWKEASAEQQDILRFLIANHQWTFVNGAWSMHDEACTHYMGMVDSTTTGHMFLKRHLGYIPKVAWQLDPFGHSATQASLLTHKMGMNAIYFGRIDYQDRNIREQTQECEGLWNPNNHNNNNNNNNDSTDQAIDPTIFWGLTGSYHGNYGAPPGFCYDVLCTNEWGVTPLMELNETARFEQARLFLQQLSQQHIETKGNDILLTMGDDFMYSHAEQYYANLDLLIHTVLLAQEWNLWNFTQLFPNQTITRVNLFYSSPEYYTARKYQQQQQQQTQRNHPTADPAAAHDDRNTHHNTNTPSSSSSSSSSASHHKGTESSSSSLWSIKTDDFFPYSDCPHCFWTGYFTSRTAFKRFERVASGFLQAARQLDVLAAAATTTTTTTTTMNSMSCKNALGNLEDALGVSQHHDSITGTAKQHVANDYSKRLAAGVEQAALYTAQIIQTQLNATFPFHYCPLLNNESICEPATSVPFDDDSQEKENALYVVIYNPLARSRQAGGGGTTTTWPVRIPVSTPGTYLVERLESNTQEQQQQQVSQAQMVAVPNNNKSNNNTVYQVEFLAGPLVPLGGITYRITRQQEPSNEESKENERRLQEEMNTDLVEFSETTVTASNGRGMVVRFDRATGKMQHVSADPYGLTAMNKFGVDMDFTEQWGYYIPYDHELDQSDDGRENSGAYIFRPSTPNQSLQPLQQQTSQPPRFLTTNRGLEVHTAYGEGAWVQQVLRVLKDQPWIEVEFTVGPVPIINGRGMEVVSRYIAPDIQNQGIFYTDSNARAFVKRQRDFRPSWDMDVYEPVGGNYYPVNAAIFIQDEKSSAVLLTDRSRGGSSIIDGTLEVKVQRRTLADDHRGVDEPLNETDGGMTPYPPYGDAVRIGDGVVIRGTHRIMVGSGDSSQGGGASLARSAMDDVFAQPLIFLGSPSCCKQNATNPLTRPSFSVLGALELPPNVFLMTLMRLEEWDDDDESTTTASTTTLLIRLAHQYGPGEDRVLSQPVQVNLAVLLQPLYKVVSIVETTLSGNQKWDEFVNSHKYNWTSNTTSQQQQKPPDNIHKSTTITIHPLDIRTFWVVVGNP